MARSAALPIAVLATILLIWQNAGAALAFTWALIHGAGASSLLAFAAAAAAIALLWGGYFAATRLRRRRRALVFAAYAAGLVVLNEVVLPATPLKTWFIGRAINRVEIRNIRDELLLSRQGNPIGIRVTFAAVVPATADYSIHASGMIRSGEQPFWPVNFGTSHRTEITPAPGKGESGFARFEANTLYTVSSDRTPDFLRYDPRSGDVCLCEIETKYISRDQFLAELARSTRMKYRGAVQVSSPFVGVAATRAEFETREYDLTAIYRTIQVEGNKRCQ